MKTLDNQIKGITFSGYVAPPIGFGSKRIEVTFINQSICQEAGEKLENKDCIRLGECSWFRHSQDTYKLHGTIGNLPTGFKEPA